MTSKPTKPGQEMPRSFDDAAGLMQQNTQLAASMFNPFLAVNMSLMNWNINTCKHMAQAYSQWFKFVGQRLEADAAFAEKLQSTKDPEQISKAYSKFLENASEDYQKEVSELTKLTSRIANEATDVLQDMSVSKQNGAVMGE